MDTEQELTRGEWNEPVPSNGGQRPDRQWAVEQVRLAMKAARNRYSDDRRRVIQDVTAVVLSRPELYPAVVEELVYREEQESRGHQQRQVREKLRQQTHGTGAASRSVPKGQSFPAAPSPSPYGTREQLNAQVDTAKRIVATEVHRMLDWPVEGKPLGECTAADLRRALSRDRNQARTLMHNARFYRALLKRLPDASKMVREQVGEAEAAELYAQAQGTRKIA